AALNRRSLIRNREKNKTACASRKARAVFLLWPLGGKRDRRGSPEPAACPAAVHDRLMAARAERRMRHEVLGRVVHAVERRHVGGGDVRRRNVRRRNVR